VLKRDVGTAKSYLVVGRTMAGRPVAPVTKFGK
jgi:hypothetical protein